MDKQEQARRPEPELTLLTGDRSGERGARRPGAGAGAGGGRSPGSAAHVRQGGSVLVVLLALLIVAVAAGLFLRQSGLIAPSGGVPAATGSGTAGADSGTSAPAPRDPRAQARALEDSVRQQAEERERAIDQKIGEAAR